MFQFLRYTASLTIEFTGLASNRSNTEEKIIGGWEYVLNKLLLLH